MSGLPSSDPGVASRDGLSMSEAPITAACFLPSHVPAARAWHRVAVVPAAHSGRQRKIWKRVPGLLSGQRDADYLRAMGELERHGAEPRKRARHEKHVDAWGEAGWHEGVDDPRDGKWDLVQARAAVSLVKESQKSPIVPNITTTKHATFPEEPLRCVPRKRHSSRFPIEPLTKTSRMVADMQPLIEFEVPARVEQLDEMHHANEEQLGRRPARRLSRRLSLFPGEFSPQKNSAVTLAPIKMGAPRLSPIKRPAIVPSPAKVAESPLQAFRVNATPVKVVLESPKASMPVTSPTKSSPVSRPEGAHPKVPDTPSTPYLAINGALIFDQPCPDVVAEPQYEAQRRRSLQSARRSDRRSSGVGRLIKFDAVTEAPNRRHSFTAATTDTKDAASRRKTLDAFFSLEKDLDEVSKDGEESAVVSIDAGADLDIFGHQPAPRRMSSTQLDVRRSSLGLEAKSLESEGPAENLHDISLPSTPRHIDLASPIKNDVGVTNTASPNASSPNQAAMCQSPGTTAETEQHRSSLEPDAHPATMDESSPFTTEVDQEEVGFEYQDPEGLSTIYEEMSFLGSEAPLDVGIEVTPQLPQGDDVSDTETAVGSPVPHKTTNDPEDQDGVERGGSADSRPLANYAAKMDGDAKCTSTNHVVTPTDVMFDHDSPERSQLSTKKSFRARLLETKGMDAGSPASSEGFSVTFDDNICVTSFVAEDDGHLPPTTAKMGIIHSTPTKEVSTPPPSSPELGSMATDARVESSGFTPINGRQVSPPNQASSLAVDEDDRESEGSDMGDDMNMGDYEVTETIDDDMTLTVVGPFIENDTLTFSHEDSETEMLRKFVTRVAADKNAKAAAAAAAAKTQRPKRRSGSNGSAASSTGSPIANAETPRRRKPLGEMNTNSPSPAKKRKHKGDDDEKQGGDAPDSADKPKRKRPRTRGDPTLDAAPEPLGLALASDVAAADLAPRRSTRSRNSRIALKPTAPSANSIALSLLPVRLPGMAGDEATNDTHVNAASRNRSEEKDLAAITRVNTRKNKSGAMPARLVLARQVEDPTWRMKELKGVFDAKESRAAAAAAEADDKSGRKTRKAKSVRWDAELVRFQGDDPAAAPSAFKALSSSLLADVLMDDDPDELAPTPEAAKPEALPPTPIKKALPRRAPSTRSSKLQAPTPVVKMAAVDTTTPVPVPTAPAPGRTAGIPKLATAAAAAAGTAKTAEAGPKTGMATRRSKIAKLGMGVNGTPAPKRRARAGV
ncbi:hypothetical protein B0T18DRAFT_394394 [Schizothecium vesticola]|uniref:Uncharacterized protein n=1 Tax=Schizothecium vesticola TaxID=314040 RepID=A0AA40BPQ2_9PEZI|nr:hypothetical protein B0T18DRAFT_394394 [Schizothecium vesticola]